MGALPLRRVIGRKKARADRAPIHTDWDTTLVTTIDLRVSAYGFTVLYGFITPYVSPREIFKIVHPRGARYTPLLDGDDGGTLLLCLVTCPSDREVGSFILQHMRLGFTVLLVDSLYTRLTQPVLSSVLKPCGDPCCVYVL